MDDLDQVVLLLAAFLTVVFVLLLLLDSLEPGADHPAVAALRRLIGTWRHRRHR